MTWYIATKRGKLKARPEGPLKAVMHQIERLKSQVRSRVEHVFHLLKDRFHHRKLRYQGLKKNGAQHHVLLSLIHI